ASRMGSGDEAGAIEALSKAAELDTASARPDVLLVLSHLRAKRFAEALAVVDQLEKERPNDPLIHNLRGTIHIARNDRVQARTHFSKALQVKPDFFPAASNLALLDMTDKDTKAARSRFEQLLKHAPKESRAWLALAALDAREKDEAGYLANLEKAKQADNKNVQVHLLLARYWLQKQDGGKALSAAREGLNSTGRQEFQEWVGLSQLLLNDHANAAGTFSRWAESNPNNPMAYFRLAQAQMRGNDNKAALQSLDKALALRADFPDASLNKAMILTRLGRSTEAIKIARSVQASAPKAVSGYLLEADILSHDKKHTEAAKLYAKSAQLSGRGQLLGRAYQAYISAGQPQEGEKLLEQWLRDHPKDLAARHELARGQLQINRLREASENYRVLIRANPQDLVAYNNLAWALGELKAPDALGIAEQALKLAPQNAAVLDTYGWQLTQAGQAKRGLPYLRDALNRNPDNPDIRWHLAVALEKTGDREAAIVELDRLLASRAQFSHESQARDLLARLKGTAR
ncbi:MAG: PEP-CTERM system TPR-repeat protein PrsT, partial [Thiobacillaceae bacterium]|nr:PEP-CTERM system TPR-repeat protein PrsT [Thiobacillaceae bacterium]